MSKKHGDNIIYSKLVSGIIWIQNCKRLLPLKEKKCDKQKPFSPDIIWCNKRGKIICHIIKFLSVAADAISGTKRGKFGGNFGNISLIII